jgi:hypothetical protein
MGQVVGKSTARGEAPHSSPVSIENLLGTVMHVLFDEQMLRSSAGLPRAVSATIERARPIAELI